jgi:S1-C subfamily serine protease
MKTEIYKNLAAAILIIVGFSALYFIPNYEFTEIATKENVTIQIVSAEWTGSGFIFEGGIIVTAAHVMQDVINAQVVFSDGTVVYLDPNTYYISQNFDLAFAKIAEYSGPVATLGFQESIVIGAGIETCGYPLGERYWHSFGFVARLPDKGVINMDIDGVPGDSGGPVFLNDLVVGILTCGYGGTQMCSGIAVNAIQAELDVYEILYED